MFTSLDPDPYGHFGILDPGPDPHENLCGSETLIRIRLFMNQSGSENLYFKKLRQLIAASATKIIFRILS